MSSLELITNGKPSGNNISRKKTSKGALLDIAALMDAMGGRCTPMLLDRGVVAQYGKRIGFAAAGDAWGMVQVKLCQMEPPVTFEDGFLWAPTGFVAEVLGGSVTLDEERQTLEVAAPPPLRIGDIEPSAKDLLPALESLGYRVEQGDMCLSDAIDVCFAGYSPNANGNNAGFPYLCIQAPQPPGIDHAAVSPSIAFTMREDEGFVLIGRTPPECDYYSFRSYLASRCLSTVNPFERQKIYTQLGDPVNSYNVQEDMFYPPQASKVDGVFESFFILVSTADRRLYDDLLHAVDEAGLDTGKVLLDVIDSGLVRFGNDDFADLFNVLHRFSNPHDKAAGEAYTTRPTLEVLRLTPLKERKAEFLQPFPARQRGSGTNEDHLQRSLLTLRKSIIDTYSSRYCIRELDTQIWLGDTGEQAIARLEDVLGETRDTLYLRSESFPFNPDTLVIVYGVNHNTIPKTVYTNVSCYGERYFNGFGGITNADYAGNVARNFPELEYVAEMDRLYVWKFARTRLDGDTFAVPQDTGRNLRGINDGDTAFIGFRNYVDPGSPDLIGPDPDEIIFDRAIVLTPIPSPDPR
ncbi:MAG: hypothetical protein HGB27_01365 [Chlorobiaceae bacterium]|nr:hypothetical protein [Chlorobiaceae bacterium]